MSLERRILRARDKMRMQELHQDIPKAKFPLSPENDIGNITILAVKEPVHKNRMLCIHSKHYFIPCIQCRRDARIARMHEDNFMRKIKI
jgi:hypothetical protein